MSEGRDEEQVYQELRRRAVSAFGEARAAELEDFLRATAEQVVDVERADTHRDLEPLHQE